MVLGHIVEMAQLLREHLEGREGTTVLNRDNFGTVTLFRAYPPDVDTFAIKRQEFDDPAFRDTLLSHNQWNRKIFQYVHSEAMAGRGVVISATDCYRRTAYGEPIYALKSYILSPFVGRSGRRGRGRKDHGSAGEGGVGRSPLLSVELPAQPPE